MEAEQKILIFLPVMKELELMGLNPVKVMFSSRTFEETEKTYVAIGRAREKYPDWYAIVSRWMNKLMNPLFVVENGE